MGKRHKVFHQRGKSTQEKCSTSLTVREMHFKNMTIYHYTEIELGKPKNGDNTRCQQRCGDTGSHT